jgi:KRAB domain-containing zinc finger protein
MKFASSGTLLVHKNLVHKKKYLQYCHICGKSFNRKKYFETHIRSKHSLERPFACNIEDCEKTFCSNYELKIHQKRSHCSETVSCLVCNKGLKSLSCLKIHMKYHEDPQFECDTINPETNQVCGRKFVTSTLLKDHITVFHRGIKKNPCAHCENSFARKSDLKYHEINVHQMRKIRCELCQSTFGSRAYYTRHINLNHKELEPNVKEMILEKIRKAKIEDLFNHRK